MKPKLTRPQTAGTIRGGVTARPTEAPSATPEADTFSIEEMTKLLNDQDSVISDLKKTIEILSQKNEKLEQLVAIKDKKLESLRPKSRNA